MKTKKWYDEQIKKRRDKINKLSDQIDNLSDEIIEIQDESRTIFPQDLVYNGWGVDFCM